jgi:hypothetical protein
MCAELVIIGHRKSKERTMIFSRPLYYILDAQGNPQPAPDNDAGRRAANELLGNAEKRRIGVFEKNIDGHEITVSTVFLVLDHCHDGGDPVLYETMLFVDGNSIGNATQRYNTKDEAIQGHNEVVKVVNDAIEELGKKTIVSGVLSNILRELPYRQ